MTLFLLVNDVKCNCTAGTSGTGMNGGDVSQIATESITAGTVLRHLQPYLSTLLLFFSCLLSLHAGV